MEQPLRLLVADDDEVDRLAVRRALHKAGVEAQLVEVADGEAALAALLEQSFDCALLDFQMPGQDGLAVVRKARAALVETPIVMITGQGDEHIAVELMKAGATDYLSKSALTPERLSHLLRQTLRLHEAEQQYRTLAELLPHTVWTSRPDGQLDYISRRGFEDTGLPAGDTSQWQRAVHPEDLPRLNERWQHCLHTGEPYETEVRLRRADGRYRWHLIRALPSRDTRGRIRRWFGTNSDIDDQKQALAAAEASEAQLRDVLAERERMEATLQERDERLRAALWASGTGTFRWDIRSGALEWDENLDQLFGLAPGRTVQRLDDMFALVHPEDREEMGRRTSACEREGADFEMDLRVVRADGQLHWLSCKGKTFVDASGRPLYMTGACVDITAQKRQEAEALQLADFERQILGIVSHDLRNPLSVIRISASMLLAREGLDERQSKSLTRIISASDRATRLIRDLLDFSQARLGGGISVKRKKMDLFELTRGVVEEHVASHPERELELEQQGDGTGEWDGDRLAQVLGNLVGNALQHGSPDTPIQVHCQGLPEEILLEVRNTGTPIDPAQLPSLFEPFRRGRQAGSGAGSVGLGLYITRQLVLAHGGHIGVASTEEEGTRFTVRLPRRAP
ncbi:PAS domain-containing protein [Archangium sp.]|uniref:hybrid sensor histidine kinase/response regulator n=1 Tax=Archangium sp. TaxID=1872627 RepID=UPI002869F2BE|nr:PAS domain-containing protein [Archangium sp.]